VPVLKPRQIYIINWDKKTEWSQVDTINHNPENLQIIFQLEIHKNISFHS